MESQKVWAPDDVEGFVMGKIVDICTDALTIQVGNKVRNDIV